tara:strand:+ start:268 stop:495 length:228 start_codon:yes stop_codon:yes gene_type:complete
MRPRVGDLVKRKQPLSPYSDPERNNRLSGNSLGIVLGCKMGGRNPRHLVATVLYPEMGKEYDIAVSLIEVVNDRR